MPRISGSHFVQLRKVLRNALDEGQEISFVYHDKQRRGLLTDIGFGAQGAFITLEEDNGASLEDEGFVEHKTYKSYSIVKMKNLQTLVMV